MDKHLKATYSNQEAIHKMKEYILDSTTPCELRYGLEYLYLNGFFHELPKLININLASPHEVNQQWGWVYQLLLERYRDQTDPNIFLAKVATIHPLEDHMAYLKMLMNIYGNNALHRYNVFGLYLDDVQEYLRNMENMFLKELFQFRVDEVLFHYHWKRNELVIGRKYAFRLINHFHNDYKVGLIHNVLAYTYIFESYEHAMYHAYQALSLSKNCPFKDLEYLVTQNTIPFISSVYGKAEGISSKDKGEIAHLAIARGEVEEAIHYLRSFTNLSPFKEYYLGKAEQNIDLLQRSYNRFIQEQSDYFFARLPLNEIRKLKGE
ncbi:AimR family lysis-lysogeny pheromone receptor [Pontibacillus yanchengensis]|nr:AimR family lysis-lysogeny pheromone receptor [Pontibacillus yanchengensis]